MYHNVPASTNYAAVIAFEDVCNNATRASMPVNDKQTCTVIEVRTAGKPQDG